MGDILGSKLNAQIFFKINVYRRKVKIRINTLRKGKNIYKILIM